MLDDNTHLQKLVRQPIAAEGQARDSLLFAQREQTLRINSGMHESTTRHFLLISKR